MALFQIQQDLQRQPLPYAAHPAPKRYLNGDARERISLVTLVMEPLPTYSRYCFHFACQYGATHPPRI